MVTRLPHGDKQATNPATLLIVEDNPDMRSFLEGILSPHYRIITASNGVKALQILTGESADLSVATAAPADRLPPTAHLIITDLMMPEMDGFTLIQHLKSNVAWQDIPVIALTARARLEDKLSVLRFGVDDYLTKPFDTEELLVRVENLLHNYRKRLEWRRNEIAKAQDREQKEAPFPNLAALLQSEETLSADQQWLERVEQIAFQLMGQPGMNAERLALELAISSRQLRRKLKQLTGLPTADYLREIRLQKARQLLENNAYHTVAEVCYAVGLNDLKHFTKIFQQHFGKNPSEYLG
jgi:DNA-binding response OmpR family regulator